MPGPAQAKDKAFAARVNLIPYTEYLERWEEIAAVFSREAILKGAFDKYAEETKGKRGTAEVDGEFLKELDRWREELARNIALRNTLKNRWDLNYAVQMIIDRLVFLRLCEDRGIERFAQLQSLTPALSPRARGYLVPPYGTAEPAPCFSLGSSARTRFLAVAEAYGWEPDISEEEVLRRLLALNQERSGKG